jgi:hypothetical protein
LISGVVETSLANVKANLTQFQQNQAIMEELATRGPTLVTSKPQIINNQYYGHDDDSSLYEEDGVKHEISNDAVMVSPSYADRISSSYHHPTSQSYVTELPNFIQSSPASYFTSAASSDEDGNGNGNLIQFSKTPYDHSDIAHSPAEADVYSIEDDNSVINPYPIPSTASSHSMMTETRTEASTSTKFSKPLFKPKPTQSASTATEKYVLVHTITNEKQPPVKDDEMKKPSTTNDSIQSILLMLNGTNQQQQQGPAYSVEIPQSTASFYMTTKAPERATTTRGKTTRKPTTDKAKTTTTRSVNKVKVSTKAPLLIQKPTTLNVPSTSYLYSPNPITKRPGASTTNKLKTTPTIVSTSSSSSSSSKMPAKHTTPKPVIIVSTQQQQLNDDIESNYVVISGGGITKHPSPTVHITPKPITNLLTSSTMQQVATKRPVIVHSTERPPPFYGSTTPATFISSSIYVPSNSVQDFHNEGYFAVVTHRPGVSSTAIYAVSPVIHDNKQPVHDTPEISNDDFSNFPPVRNPNLNMTAANPVMDASDISTPAFVEDTQLNSKIDLLVNKLIESMQGNLGNLVDIVYERKNVTTLDGDNKRKNATSSAKPQRTTVASKVTTPKTPQQKPTGRPSSQQQQPTKKPPAKTTSTTASTTKKTAAPTKKPAATPKPAAATPTKRPPNRVTSSVTTKKPTRKATTTTTTTAAPELEDEQTYEEGGDEEEGPVGEEGETAEETNEEGDENNVVDETEEVKPPPFDGKIREFRFSKF